MSTGNPLHHCLTQPPNVSPSPQCDVFLFTLLERTTGVYLSAMELQPLGTATYLVSLGVFCFFFFFLCLINNQEGMCCCHE